MTNLLKGTSVYLAGAVDHDRNPEGWRNKLKKELLIPLGIKVYDPLVKPSWMSRESKLNTANYFKQMSHLLDNNSFGETKAEREVWDGMVEVKNYCIRATYACDFVICNMPIKMTTGTFCEIKIACDAKKPVLFHMPDGLTSTWLPVQYSDDWSEFEGFNSWGELYSYVRSVNDGALEVDNYRWIFMTYHNDTDVKNDISNY